MDTALLKCYADLHADDEVKTFLRGEVYFFLDDVEEYLLQKKVFLASLPLLTLVRCIMFLAWFTRNLNLTKLPLLYGLSKCYSL